MEPKLDLTGIRRTDVVLLAGPILPGAIITAAELIKLSNRPAMVNAKSGALLYAGILLAAMMAYAIGFTLYTTTFMILRRLWVYRVAEGRRALDAKSHEPCDNLQWQLLAREFVGLIKTEDLHDNAWHNWYALLTYYPFQFRHADNFGNRMNTLVASIGIAWLAAGWINSALSSWGLGILSGCAVVLAIAATYKEGFGVASNEIGRMSGDMLKIVRKDRGQLGESSAKSATIGK